MKFERLIEYIRPWYRPFTLLKFAKLSFIATFIFALVFGVYTVYGRLHPEKRFHRLINRCDDLVKEEKYEQVVIDMTNALKIKPDYTKGHYFLAVVFMKKGETNKAVASLNRVITLDIDYKNAVDMLETILLDKKDSMGLFRLADQIFEARPVDSKIIRARGLILENKPESALEILESAAEMNPDNYRVHQYIGNLQMLAGNLDKAMESYDRSIKLNFGNWEVHYALASLHLARQKIEEAQSQLRTTLSLNPDFTPPAITLAQLHHAKGESLIAARILEDILQRGENEFEAAYTLGLIYAAIGRYQEAINHLLRLPEGYRNRKNYQFHLALAYYHTEKFYESFSRLEKLIESKNMDLQGLKLMARVQMALGRPEESVNTLKFLAQQGQIDREDRKLMVLAQSSIGTERKEIQRVRSGHDALEGYLQKKDYDSLAQGAKKALSENKFKAPFYNLLGVADLARGRIDEAKKNFLLAYNERKDNPAPLQNLVNVLLREGNISEAEKLLIEHNRLFPREPLTRIILGKIYLLTRRLDEAMALFDRTRELDPQNFEPYQQIAVIKRIQGDIEFSKAHYLKAIELNPEDAVSLNDLANIIADQKTDLDLALKLALKAKTLLPQVGHVLDSLGWVYYRRGEYEKAMTSFKDAYRLNPYLPVIPYHIGLTHYSLKQFQEAEKSLKLALNMKIPFREAEDARKILKKLSENTGSPPKTA